MNVLCIIDRPEAALTAQAQISGLSGVSIAKNYDKRSFLSDVSLSVAKGEVVGLLGPNGAGKTTCFYSIMGLVKPDSGRILLDGDDITPLPMYRRAILGLGYLPQERSEEHTSELQSLMRISYAVFCLKKQKIQTNNKE